MNSCRQIGRLTWPQHCLLCSAAAREMAVCTACYRELPWLRARRCPRCALPTGDGQICGACLSHAPRFDAVAAAFAYSWPLAPLIHNYKYAGNLALAGLFAHALAQCVSAARVDLIMPMPLATARLRERGFNQALEIARTLSRLTDVTLVEQGCRRVRDTTPQAALPWDERARNIRGAFVCDMDLRGKRVAVVDDVMTSGATLNELARNLRKAGATEIHGWMVARTLRD